MVQRDIIFNNSKLVTIYVRSNLQKKTQFFKNVKFGSVAFMVAVLKLAYHAILCKFILYLKR